MYDISYNTSGPLSPSSREMKYKPVFGSMRPKTQKMRNRRGINVESGKYDPSRKPPSSNHFLTSQQLFDAFHNFSLAVSLI
jgi:hypothetical protein